MLAVYLPTLGHDFVSYDDIGYVTANAWVQQGLNWPNVLHAFRTTEVAYWHPLTWISHLMDVELFGLHAWGHHLTSLLLHAANTWLVFVLWTKVTGAAVRSWFVAALFGLHPQHVESVAWVAERKDVLSTFFLLLTILAYVAWRFAKEEGKPRTAVYYSLALLAFAAAVMSKPMVVTLPCVLLLIDYWPLQRWGGGGREFNAAAIGRLVVEKLPFFALSLATGFAAIRAQQLLGTVQTVATYSWTMRLANAALSYARYVERCFWPSGLAAFYPYPTVGAVGPALLAGAGLVAISILAWQWRKKRPYFLVGWLWYLGILVPVIGLLQVGGQAMADRYSYLSLVGVFVIVTWGVAEVTAGWTHRAVVVGVAGTAILGGLAGLTVRQLATWQNTETLFRRALAVTEGNWFAHFGLGYAYATTPGREAEAMAEYRAALAITPDFAEAHFSLGTVLVRNRGTLPEAIAEYQAALRLNPHYPGAHFALGRALVWAPGRLAEGIAEMQTAAREDPGKVEIHDYLGYAYSLFPGHHLEAIPEYQIVVQARPDSAEAHNNLASVLAQAPGRSVEAVAEYEASLRLDPESYFAHFNLALLLSSLPGRTPETIAHLETALKLKPDLEPARQLLVQLRAGAGP